MNNFKIIVFFILFITCNLYAESFFHDGFKIDYPESFSRTIKSENVSEKDYVKKSLDITIQVDTLEEYFNGPYSNAYLSDIILDLQDAGIVINSELVYKLLNDKEQKFVLIYPTLGYEVLTTYKKLKASDNTVGELYFGFTGDGGLPPTGYYYMINIFMPKQFITLKIEYRNNNLYKKLNSDHFYLNSAQNLMIKDYKEAKLDIFYSELSQDDDFIKFNKHFLDIMNSVEILGNKITIIEP